MRIIYSLLLVIASSLAAYTYAASGLAAFNPAISAVLMGHTYYDNRGQQAQSWLDSSSVYHQLNAGDFSTDRFQLDGSELSFSSSVDSYFKAWIAATYEDGGVEVEEAWIQSLGLPAGLQIKAGRFLSEIGYHNTKHVHHWDFVTQNLAYQSLFHGEHLSGDGLQLTALLPTDNYWLIGAEIMQGSELDGFGQQLDSDEVADAFSITAPDFKDKHGPNLATAFVHFSPNLDSRQALQLGLSAAVHQDQQSVLPIGAENIIGEGKSYLASAQLVYKWFAKDGYGTGGLTLSAEYFYARSKLDTLYSSNAQADANAKQQQHAAYIQAVYGFAPRWNIGLRHAAVGFANSRLQSGALSQKLRTSRQDSVAISWNLSEFSTLRFESSYLHLYQADSASYRSAAQFLLSYIMVIGAHPAHTF